MVDHLAVPETLRIVGWGEPGGMCVICGTRIVQTPAWAIERWGARPGATKRDGEACNYCVETHRGPMQSALSGLDEEAAWAVRLHRDPVESIVVNKVWSRSPAPERKPRKPKDPGVRVGQLAKELGLPVREVLGICRSLGIDATSYLNTVPYAQADRVRRKVERSGLSEPSG